MQYHQSQRMTIELLDTESESQASEAGGAGAGAPGSSAAAGGEDKVKKWLTYVERFLQPGDTVSEECKRLMMRRPCFLLRGIRSYSKSPYGKKQVEKLRLAAEAGATRKEMMEQARRDLEEEEKERSKGSKEDDSAEKKDDSTKEEDNDKAVAARLNNGVIHHDNLQCQFDPKSLKMLYVIHSENCFYRSGSLTRAKNVRNFIKLMCFSFHLFSLSHFSAVPQEGLPTEGWRLCPLALWLAAGERHGGAAVPAGRVDDGSRRRDGPQQDHQGGEGRP